MPAITPEVGPDNSIDALIVSKSREPVKPYTMDAPYSNKPEESAPRTKYFNPASDARKLSRLKAAMI